MATYLTAFVLTVLIEGATAAVLGYRTAIFLVGLLLVNVCTHPLLNLLMSANARYGVVGNDFMLLCFLEAGVVAVEYHLLRDTFRLAAKPLFLLAFLMNFNSFSAGVLLYWI